MSRLGEFVDELNDMPDELNMPREVLVIEKSVREKVITSNRLKIIGFLREQNPVTVQDVKQLFGSDASKDLLVLSQINLIKISDETPVDSSIVELNRDVAIYPNLD